MFNGYNETPLIYDDFDQERGKKLQNVPKWPYGAGAVVQPPRPPNQPDFWPGKSFVGLPNVVSMPPSKCACPECYSAASDNQSVESGSRNRPPWFSRNFPAPLTNSNDAPNFHWENVNEKQAQYPHQENSEKFYRPYVSQIRHPGVITSAKNLKEDAAPKPDEIITSPSGQEILLLGQKNGRHAAFGNPYGQAARKKDDYSDQNGGFRQQVGSYLDQNVSRHSVVEPYVKSVPSNYNRVPSSGHRKENPTQSYLDQNYANQIIQNDEKTRNAFQKDVNNDIVQNGQHYNGGGIDYANFPYPNQKYLNKNQEYLTRDAFAEAMKKSNQIDPKRDCMVGAISVPEQYYNVPKPMGNKYWENNKVSSCGIFYPKENEKIQEFKLPEYIRDSSDCYQRNDLNPRLPPPSARAVRSDAQVRYPGFYQNNYGSCRRPEYPYPRYNPPSYEYPNVSAFQRTDSATNQYNVRGFQANEFFYESCQQQNKLYDSTTSQEYSRSRTLDQIRSEDLSKSKISPLRLMRKKKPPNAIPEASAVSSQDGEPALDVRRFWSTWAEEEDETVPQTQMVVLDCQNIDPEQAELLRLCESDSIRTVHLEGGVLSVKDDKTVQETRLQLGNDVIQAKNSYHSDKQVNDSNSVVQATNPPLPQPPEEIPRNLVKNDKPEIPAIVEADKPKRKRSLSSIDEVAPKKSAPLDKWTEKKFEFLRKGEEIEMAAAEESKMAAEERAEAAIPPLKPPEEKSAIDESLKSSSEDSSDSSRNDMPVISELPTSEYRKNKFLDYSDPVSTKSGDNEEKPSDNFKTIRKPPESDNDDSDKPDDEISNSETCENSAVTPEMDEIVQKISEIRFSDDEKDEKKPKKPKIRRSKKSEIEKPDEATSIPEPIKFSIRKSHDLKISFKVLNNSKNGENRNREPAAAEPGKDGGVAEDEKSGVALKLKSASRDDAENSRKNERKSKKKKAPVLKIKKSRYVVNGRLNEDVNESDCLNPSKDFNEGFQVHETVDSAKIKLTFKRHKTSEKENNELEESDDNYEILTKKKKRKTAGNLFSLKKRGRRLKCPKNSDEIDPLDITNYQEQISENPELIQFTSPENEKENGVDFGNDFDGDLRVCTIAASSFQSIGENEADSAREFPSHSNCSTPKSESAPETKVRGLIYELSNGGLITSPISEASDDENREEEEKKMPEKETDERIRDDGNEILHENSEVVTKAADFDETNNEKKDSSNERSQTIESRSEKTEIGSEQSTIDVNEASERRVSSDSEHNETSEHEEANEDEVSSPSTEETAEEIEKANPLSNGDDFVEQETNLILNKQDFELETVEENLEERTEDPITLYEKHDREEIAEATAAHEGEFEKQTVEENSEEKENNELSPISEDERFDEAEETEHQIQSPHEDLDEDRCEGAFEKQNIEEEKIEAEDKIKAEEPTLLKKEAADHFEEKKTTDLSPISEDDRTEEVPIEFRHLDEENFPEKETEALNSCSDKDRHAREEELEAEVIDDEERCPLRDRELEVKTKNEDRLSDEMKETCENNPPEEADDNERLMDEDFESAKSTANEKQTVIISEQLELNDSGLGEAISELEDNNEESTEAREIFCDSSNLQKNDKSDDKFSDKFDVSDNYHSVEKQLESMFFECESNTEERNNENVRNGMNENVSNNGDRKSDEVDSSFVTNTVQEFQTSNTNELAQNNCDISKPHSDSDITQMEKNSYESAPLVSVEDADELLEFLEKDDSEDTNTNIADEFHEETRESNAEDKQNDLKESKVDLTEPKDENAALSREADEVLDNKKITISEYELINKLESQNFCSMSRSRSISPKRLPSSRIRKSKSLPPEMKFDFIAQFDDIFVCDIPLPEGEAPFENCFNFESYFKKLTGDSNDKKHANEVVRDHEVVKEASEVIRNANKNATELQLEMSIKVIENEELSSPTLSDISSESIFSCFENNCQSPFVLSGFQKFRNPSPPYVDDKPAEEVHEVNLRNPSPPSSSKFSTDSPDSVTESEDFAKNSDDTRKTKETPMLTDNSSPISLTRLVTSPEKVNCSRSSSFETFSVVPTEEKTTVGEDGIRTPSPLRPENQYLYVNDCASPNAEKTDEIQTEIVTALPAEMLSFEDNVFVADELYENVTSHVGITETVSAVDEIEEEEEKVSDDKFQNVMENCLENAKKFLNNNLKFFSNSVDDLLEIDNSQPKETEVNNHISRDVLLTSCEELPGEELVLSENCQPLELSMDFVPSFNSEANNLCYEIMPVDNWPYLEEEVPSSPAKSRTDDPSLLSPPLEDAFYSAPVCQFDPLKNLPDSRNIIPSYLSENSLYYKRLQDQNNGRLTRSRTKRISSLDFGSAELSSNGMLKRRKTIDGITGNRITRRKILEDELSDLKCRLSLARINDGGVLKNDVILTSNEDRLRNSASDLKKGKWNGYNSSKWQPKVKICRISERIIKKLSKKLIRSLSDSKITTTNDEIVKTDSKKESDDNNFVLKIDREKLKLENNLLTKVENVTNNKNCTDDKNNQTASSNSIVKRKKPRFRNLHAKRKPVPDSGMRTKEVKSAQNETTDKNLVNSIDELKRKSTKLTEECKRTDDKCTKINSKVKVHSSSGSVQNSKSESRSSERKEAVNADKTHSSSSSSSSITTLITITKKLDKKSDLEVSKKDERISRPKKEDEMSSKKEDEKSSKKEDERFFKKEDEKSSKKEDEKSLKKEDERSTKKEDEKSSKKEDEKSSKKDEKSSKKDEKSSKKEDERSTKKDEKSSKKEDEKSLKKEDERSTKKEDEKSSKKEDERSSKKEDEKSSKKEDEKSRHRKHDSKDRHSRDRDRSKDRNRSLEKKRDNEQQKSSLEKKKDSRHDKSDDKKRKKHETIITPDNNWICDVCGFRDSTQRSAHIQSHAFHCQSCHLAFKTESHFIKHLTEKHKDIRNQHHCLLCELSFDTEEEYHEHVAAREHKHLESVEKNTINTLFALLTGESCPVLGPVASKPEWLPSQAGTVHFYHQATPLSLALQYLKMHHDRSSITPAAPTTPSSSSLSSHSKE